MDISELLYRIHKLREENKKEWQRVSTRDNGVSESNKCAGYDKALDDVEELITDLEDYEEL